MPLVSSPVAYPLSSSPLDLSTSDNRKRPHPEEALAPIKKRLFGRRLVPDADPEKRFAFNLEISKNETPPKDRLDETELSVRPSFLDLQKGEIARPERTLQASQRETNESRHPIAGNRKGEVRSGNLQNQAQNVDGNFWFFPSPNATQQTRPDDSSYDDAPQMFTVRSTNGMRRYIRKKAIHTPKTFQQTIAERSITAPGEATKSYYGINIHQLIKDSGDILPASTANTNEPTLEILPSIENVQSAGSNGRTMMWTEKYRAKKFTDLVGEERTHRAVLRWLKGWDPTVFPGTSKPKVKSKLSEEQAEEKHHRKILLMTGPPGLGKTTLAHVCARQAGYEVVEINASDERSRDVVNGRIKDCVGTENVRGISTKTLNGTARKPGRPVCVVVDEVDGVVSGSSGGGEGGFIKALVDLVVLDQKNSNIPGPSTSLKKPKKGDRFRMLRPIILICNDVYHPALRPLRSSNLAEIIHIRKPPLDKVVARMRNIFDNEGIKSDTDSVRRLCEATWGVSNRRDGHANSANTGEGDIRGVLVVGEWAASKLRSNATSSNTVPVLTRQWVEKNLLDDLCHGGGARGIGRGGAKEASDRVFLEGAGFPKSATTPLEGKKMSAGLTTTVGVADLNKYHAMNRLREVIDTAGEPDRILTDVFTAYPSQPFQDDNFLTKPNIAYEWLHFHDTLSSKVFSGQEWELSPYLSQSILGFHYLFSSAKRPWAGNNEQKFRGEEEEEPLPFSGPRANYSAFEAQKQNRAVLLGLQSSLSTNLLRAFRSAEDIATDLMPYLIRMLAPEVKPVIVGGSGESRGTASVRKEGERDMVRRAVEAMGAVGVTFERSRVEDPRGGYGGYVYRMEPPLDTLSVFETSAVGSTIAPPTRYAVRQVLDQEYQKYLVRQAADARHARFVAGGPHDAAGPRSEKAGGENAPGPNDANDKPRGRVLGPRRDFFGRLIVNEARSDGGTTPHEGGMKGKAKKEENRIWVSYHEGFSNAVRKPITIEELMRGM